MDTTALSYWQQLDLLASQWKEQQRTAVQKPLPMKGKLKGPRTPMTMVEMQIVDKLQCDVTFPVGSGPKRFIRRLTINSELSDAGRAYLAYVAHRFRRQWKATDEESQWIVRWKNY